MNKIISFLKEKKYFFLVLIFGYSIFLKFYYLGYQSFWIDEGFSSYVSLELFEKGFHFMKGEYLLHNLSQILSFNIFGISDFSARFFSVIFSLINTIFIYLISYKLFKNKKQAIFSALIFSFLTWEIIWARQARFYSLLQLIFSILLYLNLTIVKQYLDKSKHSSPFYGKEKGLRIELLKKFGFLSSLNIFIILSYIGILFHPFIYSNLAIFGVSIFYVIFIKKISKNNRLSTEGFSPLKFIKKNILTIIILGIILIIEIIKYKNNLGNIGISSSSQLPDYFIKSYIEKYNNHLFGELGILYFFFIISLFILATKRKILELIFLGFSFFFIFYVISQKGFLFHTRYVLILYPLIIIGASYSIFYFYNKINTACQQRASALCRKNILKYLYLIIVFLLIFISTKITFLPQKEYLIDYTSPQPNFKQAYNIIPKNSKIISGFPMMCEWYFGKKGECLYHLPVDYVGSPNSIKATLARGKDNYTNLPYLLDLNQLENGKKYYFVMDALSLHRVINKKLFNNILKNGKIIFDNGKIYNNIKVIEYIKK